MILLEDDLPGLLPIGQVSFKSFLPSKKIYLSWTARRHFLGALYIDFIFKQFLPTLLWEIENMQMEIVLNSIKTMKYRDSFGTFLNVLKSVFCYQTFMTGNLYHHLHNLALLAVPFAKRPILVRRNSFIIWQKIKIPII